MKKVCNNKNLLIIICIAIILLIIGCSFIFSKKDFAKAPSTTNEKVKDDKQTGNLVSDNKTDENAKEDDKNSEESNNKAELDNNNKTNNESNKVDKPINDDKEANKPINDNVDKNDNKENEAIQQPEQKPEVKPSEPVVGNDQNNKKRKNMENTYGVKILYGNEIEGYNPKGVVPVKLTDASEIENYLNRLNIELAKYPVGFFNDFNSKGMPLTIYLIKSANGVFSGFTDYQFMNDIKLTLATDYNFEYTIHHELMHYIDCYLEIVMYPNNPYAEYETLNPSGFIYGSALNEQIYNMASNQRGAYFITNYASMHVKEDRAEVFKFMTARAYKPIGCFEANEIIRKKAEVISKQIKTYFPSVAGYAHWDRFIS